MGAGPVCRPCECHRRQGQDEAAAPDAQPGEAWNPHSPPRRHLQLLTVLPRCVTTNIAGGLMKGTDFAATNVPGPPIPVYFAGAEVGLPMIPFAAKAGAAVNVGLMSYDSRVLPRGQYRPRRGGEPRPADRLLIAEALRKRPGRGGQAPWRTSTANEAAIRPLRSLVGTKSSLELLRGTVPA